MSSISRLGAVSGILACVGGFVVETYAASNYPGYSPISQSISRLGSLESPLYYLITGWSVVFTILITVFAYGFYTAFRNEFHRVKLASFLIFIYGLGEGLVAGIFPMDTTVIDRIDLFDPHNIASGIGVASLVLFPFVVEPLFRGKDRKGAMYTLLVAVFGLLFFLLFLLAKFDYYPILVPFKGLWQRLFQVIYYSYFMFIAIRMIKVRPAKN
ncbi:DUF998 domain-containing protein [Flavobacteriaceae bacterium F89]|uniref:DUF998 domain-containing protein n=1 Tax=Cerina litoralis TaxID=2874477 RepID=A0AAE3EUN3_9FLAO|nr:DUF998 domain-containing protein [Cerina litoralis]MCG2461243.1 DUF998 domain-containing protein [Cerina litoralis]